MMWPELHELQVIYCGWGVCQEFGRLAADRDAVFFEYADAALQAGHEFSPFYLPLRAGSFGPFPSCPFGLPGLLADALPDGWGLLLMDKVMRRQLSALRYLSGLQRLALLGEHAMGAFSFVPAQTLPPQQQQSILELAVTAQQILHGKQVEPGDLLNMLRHGGSPHGARPKVLLNYEYQSGRFDGAQMQPWLFKFPAANEHPEVCALEHWYAELARACALPIPPTVYLPLGKWQAAFGIARFDRINGLRVPMHSLAGLLHMQLGQAVCGYEDLLRATRSFTRDIRQVQQAWLRGLFNLLFHNRDDHAKNFAFCMTADGRWQLAPCFDLTFSQGPAGEHQMDFAGEARDPGREHLLHLAQGAGIAEDWAQQQIDAFCQVARHAADYAPTAGLRRNTVRQVLQCLQQQLQRLC